MKPTRYLLLSASVILVLAMLASGMVMRVGADDGAYRETVRFAEILSTVMDYYVDPVEGSVLLQGAYEGMLGGLDPNGAYLPPAELKRWKEGNTDLADAGISVLKVGRAFQIVAISDAVANGDVEVKLGDRVRSVNGQPTRELSLLETRRLLVGEAGTTVQLGLLRPGREFEAIDIELVRQLPTDRGYTVRVEDGVAILEATALARIEKDALLAELDDVRSRGVERLLVDLRNVSESTPREIGDLLACFAGESTLQLRDSRRRVIETLTTSGCEERWAGDWAVLVNGATAGAAEAIARLAQLSDVPVYGQSTYGLGAEPKLYELEDGAGVLISALLWETTDGDSWNGDGVEPDVVIEGEGEDYDETRLDQLRQVLEHFESGGKPVEEAEAA